MGRVAGDDLDNYIYALEDISRNIGREVDKIIPTLAGNFVLKPLKLRLWRQGIDGDGKKIGDGKYSPQTIRDKKRLGLKTSPITLHHKGDFYDSMSVKSSKGQILVSINPSAKNEPKKSNELLAKYGEAILMLTQREQEILAEKIVEQLKIKINSVKFPKIKFT
jgi:hypothetical protein